VVEGEYQDKLGQDDGAPLKGYSCPGVIVEILDNQHLTVYQACRLGKNPFEDRKGGRVVQSPFGSSFQIPLFDWQRMGNSKPVPMNFKIC
jgi:hypothetical protein